MQIGFIVAAVTAITTLALPNYYRSEARILPADAKSTGNLGQLAAAAAAFGVGVPGAGDSGDANFPDILVSRWTKERLLNTGFKFRQKSWFFGHETEHQQTLYAYLDAKNMDRALKDLDKILFVGKDLKTKIVTFGAETRSPELSQQITEKMGKDLEAFVMDKGHSKGGAKARFASDRLEDARAELAKAEEAFRRFIEVNRSYMISADPSVRLRGVSLEAEFKLRQQLVTTLSVNLEQALMEEKNDIPIVNMLDPANLPIEKSRPRRTVFVLMAFFGAAAVAWVWRNRGKLQTMVFEDKSEEDSSLAEKESA